MKSGVLPALALFLLVRLAMGKAWRQVLRQSFRLPSFAQAGLALILPAGIYALWPLCVYLHDRVHWAAFEWAHNPTPHFVSYFGFPRGGLCRLFLPALVEEIAWRGYLQPRFIARYGLYRGIFFVGIVWGAFHFSGDFNPVQTHADVFFHLAARLLGTIACSFVLAWLTLRSGSVLPAAITHGTLDVILFSPQPFPTNIWLNIVLWGLVGFAFFRYWTPHKAILGHIGQPVDEAGAAG